MNGGSSLRGSDGLPLSVLGIAALAAIPLTIGIVVYVALPLRTILAPEAGSESKSNGAGSGRATSAVMEGQLAQVNGRSLFSVPPPPEDVPEDRGPAPEVYSGPALIAMINGAAWFQDGTRAELGGPAENGVRLIEVNAPWGAKVEWEGGTFDVELFKRTDWRALRDSVGATPPSYFGRASGVRGRRTGLRGAGDGTVTRGLGSASGANVPPGPGAKQPGAGQPVAGQAGAGSPGAGGQTNGGSGPGQGAGEGGGAGGHEPKPGEGEEEPGPGGTPTGGPSSGPQSGSPPAGSPPGQTQPAAPPGEPPTDPPER